MVIKGEFINGAATLKEKRENHYNDKVIFG